MIKNERVTLRRMRDDDWPLFETWLDDPDAGWGPYQRFELDRTKMIKGAYEKTGLFSRDSGLLMVQPNDSSEPIGLVRYTLHPLADADFPSPEIGFVIADPSARGKGYGKEVFRA